DPLALPRTDDKVDGQSAGHEVETEPTENLVHSTLRLQHPGEERPEGASDRPTHQHQRDQQGRTARSGSPDPCRCDTTDGDLALNPDVPQPCGEGHDQSGSGEGEGYSSQEGVADLNGLCH